MNAMAKEKIRVVLIGTDVWGRQHARIFNQRKDVQFCAIAGRTEKKGIDERAAEADKGNVKRGSEKPQYPLAGGNDQQ